MTPAVSFRDYKTESFLIPNKVSFVQCNEKFTTHREKCSDGHKSIKPAHFQVIRKYT